MTANLAPNYDPDLAFKGGWVTVGLIRRPVLKVRPVDEPDPKRTILADNETRVCLTCDAGPRDTCRNNKGKSCSPHKNRLIARQCACGETAIPRAPICKKCQNRAIEQRAQEARERQAERDAELLCTEGHHQDRTPTGGLMACKTCRRKKQREATERWRAKRAS